MLLILTHENADFDAVASLLAANRLYPDGVPLLPRRINRNVSQFLTLYQDAFEFVRSEDWLRKRVDGVLLVDTLSLPSVRGMRADKVEVRVIDHHEINEDLNDGWTYVTEPVGATTTILVEMLQATGHSLTVNEATLLLLGIHEDTGSLVYDTTTFRDAQAAAWLMEEGAQLTIVRRFLNIPLSNQQQALYNRLEQAAEWINIEGQTVFLSAVIAPEGFEDEISAVAHHLRDGLLPDGMFLLVQLKYDHVQFVARSATDYLDVSLIARHLGGGGHARASAATIMDRTLQDVREEVRRFLPKSIKPMAKVANIMSFGVQTLPTSTTVSKAAEQMQRFGHEGYPVVDSETGVLVGLITRRQVDRALSHQLGEMPVSQVMKTGSVTVKPSDPVINVQKLMINEGWGQIPVISEEPNHGSNRLIGIVTRTDLINFLTHPDQKDDKPDMRSLMAKTFPEDLWDLIQIVSDVAAKMDLPLYFVGGIVRDLILGIPATDIDLVVEGEAIKLVRRLQEQFGGEFRSHQQFGTAKWLMTDRVWERVSGLKKRQPPVKAVDFVSARTEFYTRPSALPEVERGSIKLDLHRRDFTINTLAVRLDGAHLGELLDFYGGLRDIEHKLIRVLHSLSFVDDATRILRAVRLEQRLQFEIETRTAELIDDALPMLNRVTGDRIRHELEFCLVEVRRTAILERLDELGVLNQIHQELRWLPRTKQAYHDADIMFSHPLWQPTLKDESSLFIYFALLLLPLSNNIQLEVMRRLKVRKTTRDDVEAANLLIQEIEDFPEEVRPSHAVKTFKGYSHRVLILAAINYGLDSPISKTIYQYWSEWQWVRTKINGNDLIKLGMKAGPEIGEILDKLTTAKLDGVIVDDEGEIKLLNELIG